MVPDPKAKRKRANPAPKLAIPVFEFLNLIL
jgi:hypothetical protein